MKATNAGRDSNCRSLSRQYNSGWARRLLNGQKPVAGGPYGTMTSSVVSAVQRFRWGLPVLSDYSSDVFAEFYCAFPLEENHDQT